MSYKKKLLQINTVINSGSTGRIAEEIGIVALSNGWESYIAYGRNERPSKSTLIKIGSRFDTIIHGLQTRIFDRHGLGSRSASKTLIRQIREIKPDIIHLHNIHGYYLNIEILFDFLVSYNKPVVWTFHDCWPITGHCTNFDFVGCEKWKTSCYECPQKKEYPASLMIDRSGKNFSLKKEIFTSVKNLTIVPVSEWLAQIVKQSFLKDFTLHTIKNGINTSTFHSSNDNLIRVKLNLTQKFIILGVANVWSPRKGLQDFIELSKLLESEYQIILVGLNDSQINKLPKNIIGLSKTESVEELASMYASADVFVNPTWEDSFPTTNLESLACGTPVITYKTGGSPESIDSETGFIIAKGDITGIQKAIYIIKNNSKQKYSSACRLRAIELFNKDDRFREYIKLYESLLA